MKILYLADNRARGNYGCRATSTALSLLTREDHEITGVISGRYTNTDVNNLLYHKCIPGWVYKLLSKTRYLKFLRVIFYKVARRIKGRNYFFSNFDYVSWDMEEMIRNVKRATPANPYLNEFNIDNYDFDAMVVNGEGSFIFSTPGWRESLVMTMCMYWAIKNGKKVFFMNAMFSDEPYSERNMKTIKLVSSVFEKCSCVVAREKESFNYIKENMPTVNVTLIPDALFTWYNMINDGFKVENYKYFMPHVAECDEAYTAFDFTKPYILVSGSSSAKISLDTEKAISIYSKLVENLKKVYEGNVYLIQVCEGDEFLKEVAQNTRTQLISMETPIVAAAKILAQADVFVSGRYHPAIMATQGGTPCVFMSSNSHKTRSLQELLEYENIKEFNVLPSDDEIQEMCNMVLYYLNNMDITRERIQKKAFDIYKQARTMKDLIK